jgi:hypothetical protein
VRQDDRRAKPRWLISAWTKEELKATYEKNGRRSPDQERMRRLRCNSLPERTACRLVELDRSGDGYVPRADYNADQREDIHPRVLEAGSGYEFVGSAQDPWSGASRSSAAACRDRFVVPPETYLDSTSWVAAREDPVVPHPGGTTDAMRPSTNSEFTQALSAPVA